MILTCLDINKPSYFTTATAVHFQAHCKHASPAAAAAAACQVEV